MYGATPEAARAESWGCGKHIQKMQAQHTASLSFGPGCCTIIPSCWVGSAESLLPLLYSLTPASVNQKWVKMPRQACRQNSLVAKQESGGVSVQLFIRLFRISIKLQVAPWNSQWGLAHCWPVYWLFKFGNIVKAVILNGTAQGYKQHGFSTRNPSTYHCTKPLWQEKH